MSATEQANQFERFLQTMEKLPPTPGLVFHGLPADGVQASSGVLRNIVATSRNPRVATENFTTPGLACIATLTGRNIGFFSAHPAEEEAVVLPAIALVCVSAGRDEVLGVDVVVYEEIDLEAVPSDEDRAAAYERLMDEVQERLGAAWHGAPVAVTSPGKYTSRLPF